MLGGVALHAWVWAAIFHCRDVYWTQCGDYFSALGLLAAGGFVASVMLLEVRPGWVGWHALGMACAGDGMRWGWLALMPAYFRHAASRQLAAGCCCVCAKLTSGSAGCANRRSSGLCRAG